MQIEALPIHDATLSAIHVSYETGRCAVVLHVVGGAAYQLVFEGFRSLEVPKLEPWGRSCSVNAARHTEAQIYEVELQSGDVLLIEAERWTFCPVQP